MFETTVHKYRKIRKNSMEKIETDWRMDTISGKRQRVIGINNSVCDSIGVTPAQAL